jgi:hypothetical protein
VSINAIARLITTHRDEATTEHKPPSRRGPAAAVNVNTPSRARRATGTGTGNPSRRR